jgi:Nitrate/nitrite transporter
MFNLVYIITFGGFIGLSNFLPTFFYNSFGVTKIQAGQLTVLAAFMGSATRILGGYVADAWADHDAFGGVSGRDRRVHGADEPPAAARDDVALHRLFRRPWSRQRRAVSACPASLAVFHRRRRIDDRRDRGARRCDSAECDGPLKQYTGSFATGFVIYAVLAAIILAVLMVAQRDWVGKWVGKGGKALGSEPVAPDAEISEPGIVAAA